ncbi:MAG: hypothetical protein ABI165_12215, partial [Bryobacteraceae bacterium]
MNSFTSRRFRDGFATLPRRVQRQARSAYRLFRQDHFHPRLNFKKVDGQDDVYSVRVGLGYRPLGQKVGNDIVWFWVGPHATYDKLIRIPNDPITREAAGSRKDIQKLIETVRPLRSKHGWARVRLSTGAERRGRDARQESISAPRGSPLP